MANRIRDIPEGVGGIWIPTKTDINLPVYIEGYVD